ncbi:MAG: ABC transporter substrate-binding protein, partial [Thermosynechococcaceae cyanobacterium]
AFDMTKRDLSLLGQLLCVVCLGGLGLTSCTSTSNQKAKVLVYGSGGDPVNLEPGNVTDGNSLIVQTQIYDRLLDFKPGTTDLQPALATQWSSSPDGTVWTFKLRQGVQFQDGTAFNAAAVVFNVQRWWDPSHPQGHRSAGKVYEIWSQLFGGFKGDPNSLLQAVKTPDAATVQFVLKQPFAAFPDAIASGYFGIASPAAIQKAGPKYGTPGSLAVGTGPFRFQEWRTGDRIVLTKNPSYWQPSLPKSDQVVIRFVKDPAARLAQLRAGQLDFTVDMVPDQQPEIKADPKLQAIVRPSFNVGYLGLNPSYKPLADVRVRQAIAHALNRPAMTKAFWGGLAQTDDHFTPPILAWSQFTALKGYAYAPSTAKQLLTAAGYPQGFTLDLWYMPVSRQSFPTPKAIAEAMAADLAAVGIRANLKTKDWAAYLSDRHKPPGYQAFMLGWTGDYGDPDTFYYPHFGPGGTSDIGNWKDESLWKLLATARAAGDREQRAKLYAQADQILNREVLRLPIVHSQALLAQRATLSGWVPSPLGIESFAAIQRQ